MNEQKKMHLLFLLLAAGWSNIDEMTANGLQDFDYHQRKVWNMLRHDMWKEASRRYGCSDEIIEMKRDINGSIS